MITERTLRQWRMEALRQIHSDKIDVSPENIVQNINGLNQRILRLTQELMDLYLMKKG